MVSATHGKNNRPVFGMARSTAYGLPVKMRTGLLALAAAVVLAGCTSTNASSDSGGMDSDTSNEIANQVVEATKSRLDLMPALAFTKYTQKLPIDDAEADKLERATFIQAAGEGGVSEAQATKVIDAQILAGKTVQRNLFRQWSTGVSPLPTGSVTPVADFSNPIQRADDQLAVAIRQLQSQGVPSNWADIMKAAVEGASAQLPEGVRVDDLTNAVAPVANWPVASPAPTKKK